MFSLLLIAIVISMFELNQISAASPSDPPTESPTNAPAKKLNRWSLFQSDSSSSSSSSSSDKRKLKRKSKFIKNCPGSPDYPPTLNANLYKDVNHCGECNNKCERDNAYAKCEEAQCAYECMEGFVESYEECFPIE
jgi:hypothetical protein